MFDFRESGTLRFDAIRGNVIGARGRREGGKDGMGILDKTTNGGWQVLTPSKTHAR
ncbi:hypothetical protein RRSWK_02487 [Rhodopirellula sp. SWK7]|nr:hypothetical protein RRSWK_02487 [Rhodopirellula sp. SWK7]